MFKKIAIASVVTVVCATAMAFFGFGILTGAFSSTPSSLVDPADENAARALFVILWIMSAIFTLFFWLTMGYRDASTHWKSDQDRQVAENRIAAAPTFSSAQDRQQALDEAARKDSAVFKPMRNERWFLYGGLATIVLFAALMLVAGTIDLVVVFYELIILGFLAGFYFYAKRSFLIIDHDGLEVHSIFSKIEASWDQVAGIQHSTSAKGIVIESIGVKIPILSHGEDSTEQFAYDFFRPANFEPGVNKANWREGEIGQAISHYAPEDVAARVLTVYPTIK